MRLEGSEFDGARDRLVAVGATVEEVLPEAGLAELERHDVLYFPSQWAEVAPAGDDTRALARAVRDYLEGGGGVVFGQPNVDGSARDFPILDALPFDVRFEKGYDGGDQPTGPEDPDHPLVRGLPAGDLPFPADRIREFGDGWTVLVRGSTSRLPSVLVADAGAGRVVLQLANENPRAISPLSDTFLVRALEWLADDTRRVEIDDAARAEAARIEALPGAEADVEIERLLDRVAYPEAGPAAARALAALGSRIRPAIWRRLDRDLPTPDERAALDRRVLDLGADEYAVRDQATRDLASVEPRLMAHVLVMTPPREDPELRRRLEHVQRAVRRARRPWLDSAEAARLGRILLLSRDPALAGEIELRVAASHPYSPELAVAMER